jgi:hypothetical protein
MTRAGHYGSAVAESDEAIMKALTRAWHRIQSEDARVPAVVFDLSPGRSSGCTSVGWDDRPAVVVINLLAEGRKITGAAIMAFLLHLAAHAVTAPSTSSEGRWHSAGYRDAAAGLGLAAERTGSGWNRTVLGRGTATRYQAEIAAMDRAMDRWEPVAARAERSSRNGLAVRCQCDPPRRIRVTEGVLTLGAITCSLCGRDFA